MPKIRVAELMGYHITHAELIEFRQRIAKMNRLRGDAQEEEIKLRRFDASLAKKYGVEGLRYRINIDTGEIEVTPDPVHFSLVDSLNAVAAQVFEWETKETVNVQPSGC